MKALISAKVATWLTMSGHINMESQRSPDAGVGSIVVVGIALIVDIAAVSGVAPVS